MPQINKIKIRRGVNASLPAAGTDAGEMRYSTDTQELYIDDGSSNVKIGGAPSGFPVSTATQTALNLKANLASPALTGTPTTPTAAPGTNTTQVASTAFVAAAVAGGGGGNVSNSGTPVSGQAAEWTGANNIQGVAVTGTGSYVKGTSPTLVTPNVGAATASSVNGVVLTGSSTPTLAVTGTTTVSGANTGDQTTISGNAGSATILATGRTIAITGDLAYTSPSFNGSANVTAAGTLATVNSNVGSFNQARVTVNAKGLVTAVSGATSYFNVKTYGALGTGIQNDSVSMTSGNAVLTGSGFVSGDAGKVIVVQGAGASGVDLVTTIFSFTNATTITLSASAGTSVSGKCATYGTDDTAAIQAAIDACNTAGGGTVYFPDGIYIINGALVTSRSGQTYNAQLTVPYLAQTAAQIVIVLEGETETGGPYLQYSGAKPPKQGTILFSTISGSGTRPCIIGGPQIAVDTFTSYCIFVQNITLRQRNNPQLSSIDFKCVAVTEIRHVIADIFANTYDAIQPSNTSAAGIYMPARTNDARASIRDSYVMGHYLGIIANEHFFCSDTFIQSCYIGLRFEGSYHAVTIPKIIIGQCPYGIQFTGATYLTAFVDFERYTFGGPSWMNPVADIDDASNYGAGPIWYHGVRAGVGVQPDLVVSGGANLTVQCIDVRNTDFISWLIPTVADKSYTMVLKIPYAGVIQETTTKSVSGTCTATFKINTTALGGTANSVSTSEQSQTQTSANVFAAGDDIVVTTSSNAACIDAAITIKFVRIYFG